MVEFSSFPIFISAFPVNNAGVLKGAAFGSPECNLDNFMFNFVGNTKTVFEEIAKGEQKIKVSTVARRYGKITTLFSGFDKNFDIKGTAKRLKEELACGGTVKDGVIELQGNHRKQVKAVLVKLGFSEDSISD